MWRIRIILTAIIIVFSCTSCRNSEDIETIQQDNQDTIETTTETYNLESVQETVPTITEKVEEYMKFSYTILSGDDNNDIAVALKFQGENSIGAVCRSFEDAEIILHKIPCEIFIADGVEHEIHMNKSQILAIIREAFNNR